MTSRYYDTIEGDPESPKIIENFNGLHAGMRVLYQNPAWRQPDGSYRTGGMDPPLVIDELIQFPTDPPFVEAILNDGAWQVNAENLVLEDDLAPQREGPPRCPGCGRVMSDREAAEQGACNDCNGGAW